jgi:pimeloyl-ACP methyl ester carboxylesterase
MAGGARRSSWDETGDRAGPLLVLVPDAHRPAAAWPVDLLTGLERAGWRVVRLDLRDQGRSPRSLPGSDPDERCSPAEARPPAERYAGGERCSAAERYSVADLADDVEAVIDDALEAVSDVVATPSRQAGVHLLGHGLGGSIALELAARAVDSASIRRTPGPASESTTDLGPPPPSTSRIAGVTIVGGTGWLVDPTLPGASEPVVVGLLWRHRMATDPGADLGRAVARELRLLSGTADEPSAAAALAEVRRWLDAGFNPVDDHRRAWLEAPSRWDALRSLPIGSSVIHGSADPLVPVEHGRRLAALAPHARYVELPGVGHALSPPLIRAVLDVLSTPGPSAPTPSTARPSAPTPSAPTP